MADALKVGAALINPFIAAQLLAGSKVGDAGSAQGAPQIGKLASAAAAEEAAGKKQIVDIAKRMAEQSQANVGQLQSAFAQQQAMTDLAEQRGRQAMTQAQGQALAAGASGGLRANIAGAVDASKSIAGARAGFESQMAQLRADQAMQQAQQMGQAELGALGQEMLAVQKAQEMQATEAGQAAAAGARGAEWMSKNDQRIDETDEQYASRGVNALLAQGLITMDQYNSVYDQIVKAKSNTLF